MSLKSTIHYECFAEGHVTREQCENCFKTKPNLQKAYHRRAACVKENAEKESETF